MTNIPIITMNYRSYNGKPPFFRTNCSYPTLFYPYPILPYPYPILIPSSSQPCLLASQGAAQAGDGEAAQIAGGLG